MNPKKKALYDTIITLLLIGLIAASPFVLFFILCSLPVVVIYGLIVAAILFGIAYGIRWIYFMVLKSNLHEEVTLYHNSYTFRCNSTGRWNNFPSYLLYSIEFVRDFEDYDRIREEFETFKTNNPI